MKTPNRVLFTEAANLSSNVDHVLANETLDGLSHRDLYDLAEKLERASHLLLVLGDRKFQENVDRDVADFTKVPF
jgi:hypothetical protein